MLSFCEQHNADIVAIDKVVKTCLRNPSLVRGQENRLRLKYLGQLSTEQYTRFASYIYGFI